MLAIFAGGACEEVHDDPPPAPDPYAISIDSVPATTTSGSVALSGVADCDACPPSESQFGGCPPVLGPFPSGIGIYWNNVTTGQSGPASHLIHGSCVCLFSACWTVYEHAFLANVPLAIGWNIIEMAASGPSMDTGYDRVQIVRLPLAPASISASAADGGIEVAWSAVAGVSSYDLYWSDRPIGDLAQANRVEGVTSPWSHTLLPDEATRHYAVVAVQDGWRSAPSADVWATTGWRFETAPVVAPAERGHAIGLAVDGGGAVHIHTTRSSGTIYSPDYQNEYARLDAGSWTTLPVADVHGPGAGIGIDATSTPHLGWSGAQGPVHAVLGVGGWTTESVDQPSVCGVEFALDASGASHFAHSVQIATTPVLDELRHLVNQSGTWTRSVVSHGNYGCASDRQLALVVDGGGNTHLAWHGGYPGYGVLYATDRGGAWTTELVATGSQFGLALAVDPSGEPCVAWCGPGRDLQLAQRGLDGTWSAETVDDEVWSPSISLLVDGAGIVHMAYTSWPIDPLRPDALYHASRLREGWKRVPLASGVAERTALALADAGVIVAWLEAAVPKLALRIPPAPAQAR